MGMFSRLRKRRQERKAAFKAAKVRAKADAKQAAKLEKRKEAYLRKTAAQVRKLDQKELKQRRKHEEKMAKAALEQIKAGRFNRSNVARYASAARIAAPLALPLLYRGLNQLQSASEGRAARRAGVKPADMAQFGASASSDGAPQKARIKQILRSVEKGVPSGFAKDVKDRMDILDDAVDNARTMPEGQGRRVLESVSRELDLVETQIANKRD